MTNAINIDVRELKSNASKIVRNVHKHHVRYVVMHQGQQLARIEPIERSLPISIQVEPFTDEDNWNQLIKLGKRLALSAQMGPKTGGDKGNNAAILSRMRR